MHDACLHIIAKTVIVFVVARTFITSMPCRDELVNGEAFRSDVQCTCGKRSAKQAGAAEAVGDYLTASAANNSGANTARQKCFTARAIAFALELYSMSVLSFDRWSANGISLTSTASVGWAKHGPTTPYQCAINYPHF